MAHGRQNPGITISVIQSWRRPAGIGVRNVIIQHITWGLMSPIEEDLRLKYHIQKLVGVALKYVVHGGALIIDDLGLIPLKKLPIP